MCVCVCVYVGLTCVHMGHVSGFGVGNGLLCIGVNTALNEVATDDGKREVASNHARERLDRRRLRHVNTIHAGGKGRRGCSQREEEEEEGGEETLHCVARD